MEQEPAPPTKKYHLGASIFTTPLLVGFLSGALLLGAEVVFYSPLKELVLEITALIATVTCGAIVIGSFLLFICALCMVPMKKTRKLAIQYLISSFCLTLPTFLALIPAPWLKQNDFERIERNAKPLIEAIHKYDAENNHPPENLEILVPKYIDKIPFTGDGRCPEYSFKLAEKGNIDSPWELTVYFGIFFLGGRDRLVYWPSENYPQQLDGLKVSRFGKWAYLDR